MYKTTTVQLEVKVKSLSRVRLLVTPWTAAHQVPLFMEIPRQKYWSGLPFPSPGNVPNPGIKPRSPELQADALASETIGRGIKKKKAGTHRVPGFNLWSGN